MWDGETLHGRVRRAMGQTGGVRAWRTPARGRALVRGWWPREGGDWPRRYRWVMPLAAVAVTVRAFDTRGWVVAAIAAVFWGWMTLGTRQNPSRMIAWSRAHPVLDSMVMLPVAFLAFAILTRIGLGWCALGAVALWLAVLVLGTHRRRQARERCGPPGVLLPLLALALLASAFLMGSGTTTAHARSVSDPDIGWPTALRRELGLRKLSPRPCRARDTRASRRRENRIERHDPRNRLYTILHDRPHENLWGNLWSTACDGGRLQVGVASTGTPRNTRRAVARARRYLRDHGQRRDVRLVAVRSTYRQLMEAQGTLESAFATQLDADIISPGLDTTRNAIEVEVAGEASAADRAALKAFARDAPVNVLLRFEPPPDPNAPIPTYTAGFTVDRATVRRGSRDLTVTVGDSSCAADETFDSAARFAGVRVTRAGRAFVLVPRFRVNPDWPRYSTCVGTNDPRLVVTTTVRLPGPLGRRAIVEGSRGSDGPLPVVVPPVGASAIRSLVPRFVYSGDDCEAGPVARAFRGRRTSEWCEY